MYDITFIEKFMPKLHHLASKYENDTHDKDELLSEGQMYLLEYLSNKQNKTDNLEHKAYVSVDGRLKTFVNKTTQHDEDSVLNESVICVSCPMCNSDELLAIVKQYLTPKEYDIIIRYYGILSNSQSCVEIAKDFGVSSSRISAIKQRAVYKLRYGFMRDNIKLDDLFTGGM